MAKFKVKNEIQKLSLDLYNGSVEKYSVEEANDVLRTAINDACGGTFNKNTYMDNKGKVFQILEDVLSIASGYTLYERFEDLAEIHDVALGDTIEFTIEDTDLFKISTISVGNRDIRRQKLYGKKLTVSVEKLAVKIYEDLDRFLAGRINWANMIDRVANSFAHEMGIRIYNSVYAAYDSLTAPYQVAMSGTFDEAKLIDAIAHVEASTGKVAKVLGTKKSLAKITTAEVSDEMKNTRNQIGHYGVFKGTALNVLPQGHKAGTSTFAVSDEFLIVIPDGEKIVKVILEGDVTIEEAPQGNARNDESIEFFMGRKVGIATITANNYAIVRH
jgi:hypothetical protein